MADWLMLILFCQFFTQLVVGDHNEIEIINGTDANIADYPWMVAVYTKISVLDIMICGGSLISPEWVLTAGHCTETSQLSLIVAGSSNLNGDNYTVGYIAEVILHPNFTDNSDDTYFNDIVLLRLKSPVNGPNISPINLPEPDALIPEERSITITGWGDTTGDYHYSNDLKVATVVIPTTKRCIEAYAEHGKIIDKEGVFCAGTIGDTKGTCHGDNGGPAEINRTLIGIVSWGLEDCSTSGLPAVLVNVAKYRNWIREVTGI